MTKRLFRAAFSNGNSFDRASERYFFTHAWHVVIRRPDGVLRQFHGFASTAEIARAIRNRDTNWMAATVGHSRVFSEIVEARVVTEPAPEFA